MRVDGEMSGRFVAMMRHITIEIMDLFHLS